MTLGYVGLLDRDELPDPSPSPRPATMSEEALFRGYSGGRAPRDVVAPEPCVCGGVIAPRDVEDIPVAVGAHQATPEHLAWRRRLQVTGVLA